MDDEIPQASSISVHLPRLTPMIETIHDYLYVFVQQSDGTRRNATK